MIIFKPFGILQFEAIADEPADSGLNTLVVPYLIVWEILIFDFCNAGVASTSPGGAVGGVSGRGPWLVQLNPLIETKRVRREAVSLAVQPHRWPSAPL